MSRNWRGRIPRRRHMTTGISSRTCVPDADAEDADWREVAQIVLHIEREPRRARRAYESHLNRARWMTEHGYRHFSCETVFPG